ncbi:hypothetical protein ACOT81_28590 [Streptomyces sp. WI04-05B]|uniref:hypothetical protein n=1 Tax=Streptomyces TaxID=1883 RepID=UPI0029A242E7|nr:MULTISPECIES: hypothetical protein [unclassified Streptomyces]MDX2544367.1 hypothetical protein [Streptomyces sp. WI04-05B]MDX2588564.1 hypothetical protein [Streptomyces sp. WI04-05A]
MRRTTLAALCLTAVTVAGVAGCQTGGNRTSDRTTDKASDKTATDTAATDKTKDPFAGLSGDEIAERALTATSGASSLRMTGDVPDDESGGTIRIDMALDKRGECAGTMSMNGQGKADLVKSGSTLYMKYDEKFLRAQSEGSSKEETDGVVAMLAGKWTKMATTGSDAKDLAGFCDLDSVLADFKDGTSGTGSGVTRGATTTVDGKPAVLVTEKDGKDTYTMYVASEGKPYLLRVDSKSAKDPGTVVFSEYDKPVSVRKPTGEILDLDALGG